MSFKIPTFWIFVEIIGGKCTKQNQFKTSANVKTSVVQASANSFCS